MSDIGDDLKKNEKAQKMEYNYQDLCMPPDHPTDEYTSEYEAPYVEPSEECEYQVRCTVRVDGGDRFGVSAVAFDKFEELVWMGNKGGHVTSYYGPTMKRYTSFQIHESEEVRDIITMDPGLYCLTKTTLRHQIRRGLPKHTYKSDNMVDMQCLFQNAQNKLLMGGHQSKILELDLVQMKESLIHIEEEGCVVLRTGGGALVACGSASGTVCLRDVRSPSTTVHSFKAHSACLSDLDMQGDLLITCGFTQNGGVTLAEPFATVWDVRMLRGGRQTAPAWSARTPAAPVLLHFLPAVARRAVALAADGQAALLRLDTPADPCALFKVDNHNSVCNVVDVSSSSQSLVFGDQSGHLSLFSHKQNEKPVFNPFSRKTTFADDVPSRVKYASFNDTSYKYSSVPLQALASGSRWFNELPREFYKRVYRRPKPVDPNVLSSMKMQGPIGHAPNPGTCRRNQMPYVEDKLEDLKTPKQDAKLNLQPIPDQYIKVDNQFNKQGNSDDAENLNSTGFPGLEATLPNSYCNPMLQVLYYTAPVKATLLAHTCAKEFCLSCELGFLFRMLDTSGGATCQASNFLRAFRTVPEASALGLILPDRGADPRVDLIALIQSWNRFILHQMHYEILETKKKEKELALLAQSVTNLRNGVSRLGNVPLNTSKLTSRLQSLTLNGPEILSPEKFHPVEEEYHRNGEPAWAPLTVGPEEGAMENGSVCDSNELPVCHNAAKEESDISKLFAIGRHQLNRCLKCNKEEERESVALACALQYPAPSKEKEKEPGAGFVELVRASLASRRSTPAWCEHCKRFSPTVQRGRVVRLPPILAINFGGITAHEKAYWSKGAPKEMVESSKRGSSSKPCRYGLHCARPGCRFKHPDRPSTSPANSPRKTPTAECQCILPRTLHIRLQPDGEVVVNDKKETMNHTKDSKSDTIRESQLDELYELSAVVLCVEDTPKNLVAFIQMKSDGETQWYLFNDISIIPVTESEVVEFGSWWKSPCVMLYNAIPHS